MRFLLLPVVGLLVDSVAATVRITCTALAGSNSPSYVNSNTYHDAQWVIPGGPDGWDAHKAYQVQEASDAGVSLVTLRDTHNWNLYGDQSEEACCQACTAEPLCDVYVYVMTEGSNQHKCSLRMCENEGCTGTHTGGLQSTSRVVRYPTATTAPGSVAPAASSSNATLGETDRVGINTDPGMTAPSALSDDPYADTYSGPAQTAAIAGAKPKSGSDDETNAPAAADEDMTTLINVPVTDNTAWMRLDLGKMYAVSKVELKAGSDTAAGGPLLAEVQGGAKNLKVYVGGIAPRPGIPEPALEDASPCTTQTYDAGASCRNEGTLVVCDSVVVSCDTPNPRGHYVWVEKSAGQAFRLAEMVVQGVPKDAELTPTYTDSDSDVTGGDAADGDTCSGRGFKCDFRERVLMGDHDPFEFIWKVIDPETYGLHEYQQVALPCTVDITPGDKNTSDWFYVPLGDKHYGSPSYCATEAVKRVVNNTALGMSSEIRIRAETNRLNGNSNQTSTRDLIGEQFTVICKCTVDLSTEASLAPVSQSETALLTQMTATGQTRKMEIEMRLYSDELLLREVSAAEPFPSDSSTFFFLVRHLQMNDWDVMLQVNTCVACNSDFDTECVTANQGQKGVITFLKNCRTIAGGPKMKNVSHTSWYADYTVETPWKNATGQWAGARPTKCPYYAFGMQKFRVENPDDIVSGRDRAITISCAVVGCDERPCTHMGANGDQDWGCDAENVNEVGTEWSDPFVRAIEAANATAANDGTATGRRLLSRLFAPNARSAARRTLQGDGGWDPVDATLQLTLSPDDFNARNAESDDSSSSEPAQEAAAFSLILLLVVLLMLVVAATLMRHYSRRTAANRKVVDATAPVKA